ncbi:glycoside hydrolase family 6 protein [Streptomyces sp. JJ36]|nr:glycoside hydrolase family 6 protein [Streptomyces sp. JJ36]
MRTHRGPAARPAPFARRTRSGAERVHGHSRSRLGKGALFGAATAAVLALLTGAAAPAGAAPDATRDAAPGAARDGHGRTDGGTRLHTPPANPDAYRQIGSLLRDGEYADAARVFRMVRTPQAVWFTGDDDGRTRQDVRRTVREADRKDALPVLSLYNVPGRDCAQYSAGGASDTAEYRAWIDEVVRGIGHRRALIVLEPDSLALLPSDCGQDDAEGTLTDARYEEVRYAVDRLGSLPRTTVYLDAGHSGWHAVGSIVPRLVRAGVEDTRGFYLNASNYRSDAELAWYGTLISGCLSYVAEGGAAADCPDQWSDRAEARAWLEEQVTAGPADRAHYVTDTSRNGRGPWTPPEGEYSDPQDWCNPPDRGLGKRPTTRTGDPLHDARLWIKIPGESDGECLRGTEGPEDPERGMVDPPAGAWFPEQARELVRFAEPPLFR